MLVYRPPESWAPNADWTLALPAGEDVLAIAAGRSFCAAATSSGLLRLFSLAGGSDVGASGPLWNDHVPQTTNRLSAICEVKHREKLSFQSCLHGMVAGCEGAMPELAGQ